MLNPKIDEDTLYSMQDVAEMLGVTRFTVMRWNKKGSLKFKKIFGRNYISGKELLQTMKL